MTRARAALALAALTVAAIALRPGAAALGEASLDLGRFARPLDSVAVRDRTGALLRVYRPDGVDLRWVSLSEISPDVVDAFLAAEDARFREHSGVDGLATLRALGASVLPGRRMSGASTITQQLVKLVFGRPHGLSDKPLEIARALAIEDRFGKDEILEQYLNRVPMGNGVVGVARAAEAYFGRPVSELGLGEAALLAGIPQAPSAGEPRRHLARALARTEYVLSRLEELGWRDSEAIDLARTHAPMLVDAPVHPWRAPRFVDLALRERAREARAEGELTTTLDAALTDAAEAALRASLERAAGRGAENGAAILIANESGEILAYVGAARTEDGSPGASLDLLRAPRQPGSTLKPFAYELFFERGGTPASVLDDIAGPMTIGGGESFLARDFDRTEGGPVRARVALAASLNLAALDVVRRVGAAAFTERLAALSFRGASTLHDDAGAGVVLGGMDVTAVELARAYAALARGGTLPELHALAHDAVEERARVMDPTAASLVLDVLSDADARRLAFGRDLEAEARGPFALKTGTSSGYRDAWAVALDADFTAVVWIGRPSGAPMDGVTGFSASAPVAAAMLGEARARRTELDALGAHALLAASTVAPLLVTVEVCSVSGALATHACPHRVRERFASGRTPTEACALHASDGRVLVPARYGAWLEREVPPGWAAHADEARGRPVIAYPERGAVLLAEPSAGPIRFRVDGGAAVTWEVDGRRLVSAAWMPVAGRHRVVAIAGEQRSEPVAIELVGL